MSWLSELLDSKKVAPTPPTTDVAVTGSVTTVTTTPGVGGIAGEAEKLIIAVDPGFVAQVEGGVNAGIMALCAKYGFTPLAGEIESFLDPEIKKILTGS